MIAMVFYHVAEYCDFCAKLTLKQKGKEVKKEIWRSDTNKIEITTKKYLSARTAYKAYKIAIAEAILGGWKVLNALPQRETWETKRSK